VAKIRFPGTARAWVTGGAQIETLFDAVLVLGSRAPHVAQAVRDCIAYLASPATAQAKQRYFLSPA
jgi:hypothetical protein